MIQIEIRIRMFKNEEERNLFLDCFVYQIDNSPQPEFKPVNMD